MKKLCIVLGVVLILVATVAFAAEKETTSRYAGLAQEITTAIVDTAKLLNVTAAEFIKTDLGRLMWWFLFWKLLGKTMFCILLGLPLWITANVVLFKVYKRFFDVIQIKDENGHVTRTVNSYEFRDDGALGVGIVLTILACVINILGVAVVFG